MSEDSHDGYYTKIYIDLGYVFVPWGELVKPPLGFKAELRAQDAKGRWFEIMPS